MSRLFRFALKLYLTNMKTTVKIHLASGNSFVSEINLSPERALRYYLTELREVTSENELTGEETVDNIISVEVLA